MVANNGPCYGEVGNGERFRTQVIVLEIQMVQESGNNFVFLEWCTLPFNILDLSCTHCLQGIPKKMKELEFAHVLMVGTAANMAVYVLRDTEEEDQVY